MKRLFKINITHYAPKDYEEAIKEYVVAEKDRDVFEYLAKGYAYWEDILEDYNGEGSERCREQYEDIFNNKGDERDVSDLYYGATQYGWEEVELDQNTQIDDMLRMMVETKIAKEIPIV